MLRKVVLSSAGQSSSVWSSMTAAGLGSSQEEKVRSAMLDAS